jgi:voltage-gated potassium channel
VIEKVWNIPGLLHIKGNATHDDILQLVQLQKAKALITTLPFDADNLFVVLSVKEINPD